MHRRVSQLARLMIFGFALGFASLAAAQATEETKTETKTTTKKKMKKEHSTSSSADATSGAGADADNTKKNKRDRSDSEPTADQQHNSKSDVDLTAQIRKSVVADKGLSMYAHNVKIIVQDGVVTLKGPVHSDAEKMTVEQKAVEAVGKEKVKNEIEVKP